MAYLPYAVAIWLFGIGCIGLVRSRNVIHAVLCLSEIQASTYVLLVAIGYKRHATAPIYGSGVPVGSLMVDPIVQALTLTDIVVATVVTALLLTMAVQIYRHAETLDPEKLRPMQG
jgi:multicomponent Na+:H+ antiporter subunit C